MFNLLRQSGTLAQLMTGEAEDENAFARGVLATGHRHPRVVQAVSDQLGLFTHTVYSASPWEIPVLRRKVQRILDRSGFA